MSAAPQLDCLGGRELRKFDQANRLTIPPRFRSRYDNAVYLFKNFQSKDCIVLYSEEDYIKVFDNISKVYTGEVLTKVQQLFINNIDMATMDKSGRISIKPDFIEFAGLGEEALMICFPDRIEIWDPAKWDAQFKEEELPDLSAFNISPRS